MKWHPFVSKKPRANKRFIYCDHEVRLHIGRVVKWVFNPMDDNDPDFDELKQYYLLNIGKIETEEEVLQRNLIQYWAYLPLKSLYKLKPNFRIIEPVSGHYISPKVGEEEPLSEEDMEELRTGKKWFHRVTTAPHLKDSWKPAGESNAKKV